MPWLCFFLSFSFLLRPPHPFPLCCGVVLWLAYCVCGVAAGVSAEYSSKQYGLLCDRYIYCEKCFNEIKGEEVELCDDPSQPAA